MTSPVESSLNLQRARLVCESAAKVDVEPITEPSAISIPEARSAYILPAGFEGRERTLAALLNEGFQEPWPPNLSGWRNQRFEPGAVVFPLRLNDGAKLLARIGISQREPPSCSSGRHRPFRFGAGPRLGSRLHPGCSKGGRRGGSPCGLNGLGAVMHTLRETGIAFAQVRADRIGSAKLHRYTHIILVDDGSAGKGWQRILGDSDPPLKSWATDGGVLLGLQAALFTRAARDLRMRVSSSFRK